MGSPNHTLEKLNNINKTTLLPLNTYLHLFLCCCSNGKRLRQISGLAIRAAVLAMMIAALAGGLIGGIFYPILIKAFLFILYVFLFSYLIACRVYDKRM